MELRVPYGRYTFPFGTLVTLIRSLTWKEVYDIALQNNDKSVAAIDVWLQNTGNKISI